MVDELHQTARSHSPLCHNGKMTASKFAYWGGGIPPGLTDIRALLCASLSRLICSVCMLDSVNMGEGGLDALVTLGQGDMRRTLNILQVCSSPLRHARML